MNIGLLVWFGDGQRNPLPGKYVWVEPPLHGETCAKQTESFQAQAFGRVASCFDNAYQGDRGLTTNQKQYAAYWQPATRNLRPRGQAFELHKPSAL